MSYKIGTTGTIKFKESSSKVRICDIITYTYFPSDIVFEYLEEEVNRPLVNDEIGENKFNIPEEFVQVVFTAD